MKVKDLDVFKANCETGFCNRGTIYNSKTCKTDNKQDACYKKYLLKVEIDNEKFIEKISKNKKESNQISEKDEKELELKKIVWLRDSGCEYNGSSKKNNWTEYCVFWSKIFTNEEKTYILKHHVRDLWLAKTLDMVHIESRARNISSIYDEKNVILGNRWSHSLLDGYRDLTTGEPMSNEDRENWLDRLREYIRNIY